MIAQITIDDAYAYIELAVIAELLTRTDKLMFYFENMKVSLMNGITKIKKKLGCIVQLSTTWLESSMIQLT